MQVCLCAAADVPGGSASTRGGGRLSGWFVVGKGTRLRPAMPYTMTEPRLKSEEDAAALLLRNTVRCKGHEMLQISAHAT